MGDPTLAEQLRQVVRQAGVERVYGVGGDRLNPVVDAIRRTDGIEWVHVRNEEAARSSPPSTDHAPVNHAAIAEAAGLHAVRIEQPGEIRAGLGDALAHPGPAPVDLATDPNALSIPPHPTAAEVKGFTMGATKVVLNGRVGRLTSEVKASQRKLMW